MGSRRRWAATLAPVVAVAAVGAGAAVAIKWEADRWAPAGRSRTFSITCLGSPAVCGRIASEMANRPELGDADTRRAAAEINNVIRLMSGFEGPAATCASSPAECSPSEFATFTGRVRANLGAAGYPNAAVRTAGENDLAPAGALIVAAPVGAACVVYTRPPLGGTAFVLAQNPDGSCLAG